MPFSPPSPSLWSLPANYEPESGQVKRKSAFDSGTKNSTCGSPPHCAFTMALRRTCRPDNATSVKQIRLHANQRTPLLARWQTPPSIHPSSRAYCRSHVIFLFPGAACTTCRTRALRIRFGRAKVEVYDIVNLKGDQIQNH
jgi:hypothetical protein